MVTGNARVSDLAVAKVRRFCDQRVPAEARDQVCLEVTTQAATITIVERRPLWQGGPGAWTRMPIAQLRYDPAAGTWTLDWADRNRRWHRYDHLDPTPNSTTCSRRSTRTPSPCSGDSAAPTGIAARDQLVRLPNAAVRFHRSRSRSRVRLDLGPFMVGAASTPPTSNDAFAETQRSPWPFGSHRLQPGAYGEAWQQAWK